jgi:hypothetical protein
MAWPQNGSADGLGSLLAHRVADLQRELRWLGPALHDYRADIGHGAREVSDVLVHQGARLARRVARDTRRAARAVKQDPVPALAMAVAAGCLLSLVLDRPKKH